MASSSAGHAQRDLGPVIAPASWCRQQRQEGAAPDGRRGRRPQGQGRDRVKKGDIVVRLDETQARTSLAIVTKALDEMEARQARLEAERDGANKVTYPAISSLAALNRKWRRRRRASSGCSSAAIGARGPEGAAPRADRPAPPADRRHDEQSRQINGDRVNEQELGGIRGCGNRTWCHSTA